MVLHPNIEPNGMVYACCGPSRLSAPGSHLILGNSREEPLADILSRSVRDPILAAINSRGPHFLQYLTEGVDCGVKMPPVRSSYTSICELCMDMTNSPAVVSALRDRLQDVDALILLEHTDMRVNSDCVGDR